MFLGLHFLGLLLDGLQCCLQEFAMFALFSPSLPTAIAKS